MAKDQFTLEQFISKIKEVSFSKPYSFSVNIDPLESEDKKLFTLFCKAATIPTHTNTITNIPHKGRIMKVPGERTYPEWTCTFISDETHIIRKYFEEWSEDINSAAKAFRNDYPTRINLQTPNPIKGHFRKQITINQLGADNTIVAKYNLVDAWPTIISQMELNAESISNTQDLTITFAYQYYIIGERSEEVDTGITYDL